MTSPLLRLFLLFLAALLSLGLFGCSNITQAQAEQAATLFINQNVKFFSKDGNSTKDIEQYGITSMDSYRDGRHWAVVAHVSSPSPDGTIKKNDLLVKVNYAGEVVEFNGQRVPT